jgi:hypothetical protein
MVINVSDLYDAFHQMLALARSRFGINDETDPSLADFADQIEVDLFLPACARRTALIARRDIEPEEAGALIRLREHDGSTRAGAAGRYHSHGFDEVDEHGDVRNVVVAANLMRRPRSEVDLVIRLD